MGLGIVLGVLVGGVILAARFFSSVVIFPRTHALEYSYDWEVEHGEITPEGFGSWPR